MGDEDREYFEEHETRPDGITLAIAMERLLRAAERDMCGAGTGIGSIPRGEELRKLIQACRKVHLKLRGYDKTDW